MSPRPRRRTPTGGSDSCSSVAGDESAWIDRSWRLAHDHASGQVYANFPDAALADWAAAYRGPNYPALVKVKRMYDPDEFFHFPQSIPIPLPASPPSPPSATARRAM